MSLFEFLEFEGHGFVLPVSPLWVSPVVQDLGDFFESFVEGCEVESISYGVLLHKSSWACY